MALISAAWTDSVVGPERRGAAEPETLLYRFTVKCDRDRNRLVERRARACGISATAYVQRHFERLFQEDTEIGRAVPAPPAPQEPEPAPVSLPEIAARRTDDDDWEAAAPAPASPIVGEGAAAPVRGRGAQKVLEALTRLRQPDGTATIDQGTLAAVCRFSTATVNYAIKTLLRAGLIRIVRAGGRHGAAVYHVVAKPEEVSP